MNQNRSILYENFVWIIVVGFLFSSLLSSIFSGFQGFNIAYRGIVVLASCCIILYEVFRRKVLRNVRWIVLFLIIYSFRIMYDLFLRKTIILWDMKTSTDYILIYLALCAPTIALMYINMNRINFDVLFKKLYYSLFVLLILALFFRSQSDADGRNLGGLEIGVLVFGQYGTMFSLLSLFKLLQTTKLIDKILYLLGYIFGFIVIFVSASKSPLLALILLTILMVFYKVGFLKSMIYLLTVSACLIALLPTILEFLESRFSSNMIQRIIYALEGADTGRGALYLQGITEFIDYPFLGSAFLIQKGLAAGIYPHNLIIEAFMACGIVGGILFLSICIKGIKESLRVIKGDYNLSWIGILFLQYFLFSMFSGSLHISDLFWYFLVIVCSIYKKEY